MQSLFHRGQLFSVSAFALFAFCLSATATSITLQGGFGYPKATAPDGSALADGHKVSIGTFADGFLTANGTLPEGTTLPQILANWKQFHFTTTATLLDDPGSFWLKHSSPTGTNPEGFSFPGKKIYLLLTRTDAAYSEPAADGSNVRDYALFTSADPAWTFRSPPSETNLPPGDLSSINTSQITTALVGIADPAAGAFALTTYSSGNPGDGGTTASAFDQWITATFGENSGHTADSIVGPAGLTALATYALASTPQATVPPYTTITDENGRIGIEYTRTIDPALHTHAQACTNLSSWALPVTESIVSSTETTETVRAFPDFPEGSDQSKAFFRIRVEPAGN
jgi:hypothetical protein